ARLVHVVKRELHGHEFGQLLGAGRILADHPSQRRGQPLLAARVDAQLLGIEFELAELVDEAIERRAHALASPGSASTPAPDPFRCSRRSFLARCRWVLMVPSGRSRTSAISG